MKAQVRNNRLFSTVIFLLYISLILFPAGCTPTYPKGKIKESIIDICKKEYNIDVKAETSGKTVAIYLPLQNLLDFTFAITPSASEKINNVILSTSRVVLSTDAKFDFYLIIAHDIRLPEIQIVIIKYVDDVKRLLLNDISRGEYSKRMLIDIRLNPQSQKERSVKDVFEKMNVDKKWQEDVMNDFFRSEPTVLNDIGYWNGRFYIKDISLAEFLAEQMASRVRIEYRDDSKLGEFFIVKSSKGSYGSKGGKKYFRLEAVIVPKWFGKAEEQGSSSDKYFTLALKILANVTRGYRFTDFDYVEIVNETDGEMMRLSRQDLEKFRKNAIKFKDLVKAKIN